MSPKLTRREFLAGAIAAGVTLHSPSLLATPVPRLRTLTDHVKLGSADVKVSYLGLGTGTIGWNQQSNQTRLGHIGFARLVRRAFDLGVNYFDLADIYGSHRYFSAAMRSIPRDEYVIQTKIWFRRSEDAQKDLERFLQELRTDYIDILFIHSVDSGSWPDDQRRMMDVLEAAKEKKLIRAHGVSIHSLDAMKAAAESPWVDIALCRINHTGDKMDASPAEVVPVLKKMHAAGKGVTGMKILGEGTIAEQRDKSLRYVLGLDCVDSIVIGFESSEQIEEILSIGKRLLDANG